MEKQRESRIDLLRGLALLLIFVGHSEFTFSGFVQHSRGFADAADVFVLLAGVSVALAYYRPDGSIQFLRPWKRAFTLYFVHMLLFSVLAGISGVLFLAVGPTPWADMNSFWDAPYQHGAEAFGLADPPLGEWYHQVVSKTNSGPLRILNVLAILYLAWNIRLVHVAANRPAFGPICAAGKHSLPVFSLGVLLVFVAKTLMNSTANTALPVQVAMLVTGCLLHLALAWWLEERRQHASWRAHVDSDPLTLVS